MARGRRKILEDTFPYLEVCENCTDEFCCAAPFFFFCAKNEVAKIEEIALKLPRKFHKFLEPESITYENQEYEFYGLKQVGGKCIFLKNPRLCRIHEHKPLQCRAWPLVWGFEEEGNKLIIYIDEDPNCPLVAILLQNREWIENMKKIIVAEVSQMDLADRFAFTSLEGTSTQRVIDEIHLQ